MLTLSNLKGNEAATKTRKRVGRGMGSGLGRQSGKGHKGQKARSGGGIRLAFEGGQTPQYRQLPKLGFKNAPFKKVYAIVNLSSIAEKFDKGNVTHEGLLSSGLIASSKKGLPVKILSKGEFNKKLCFKGKFSFSEQAKKVIALAGGIIE